MLTAGKEASRKASDFAADATRANTLSLSALPTANEICEIARSFGGVGLFLFRSEANKVTERSAPALASMIFFCVGVFFIITELSYFILCFLFCYFWTFPTLAHLYRM